MSPFDEGVMAAASGLEEADNPYTQGTAAHAQWEQGFRGFKDDEAGGEQ